jgi:hypothetical protein
MLINRSLSVFLNALTIDIKDDKDSYNRDECVHGLGFVKRVEWRNDDVSPRHITLNNYVYCYA